MLNPVWYSQLRWSAPELVHCLDEQTIPLGAGLYAFTNDPTQLGAHNALYVGKADGARQTLRTRLGAYRRRFAAYPSGKQSRHYGMERLAEYFHAHPNELYIRWAGVVVARELEGTLILMFDPRFNNKEEHRHGFADDELIPDAMLY